MGGKPKDFTGQTFGVLTVMEEAAPYPGKKTGPLWKCFCNNCGSIVTVPSRFLYTRPRKTCEHCRPERVSLISVGQKKGHLTMLSEQKIKGKGSLFTCRCDCGQIVVLPSQWIYRHKNPCCDVCRSRVGGGGGRFKDLTGYNFGALTVKKRATPKSDSHNRSLWECVCRCGNTVIKSSDGLKRGAQDCGCNFPLGKWDLGGKVFGNLCVIRVAFKKNGSWYWECKSHGSPDHVFKTRAQLFHLENLSLKPTTEERPFVGKRQCKGQVSKLRRGCSDDAWAAKIIFHYHVFRLGTYKTEEEASAVAAKAAASIEDGTFEKEFSYLFEEECNER